MAEFHFYGSNEDRPNILEALFGLGLRVIPNLSYERPSVPEFSGLSRELERSIAVNKVLYVTGPFSIRPPFLIQLPSGKYKGAYEIDPTRGGPLLALALPGSSSERGRVKLTPGHLSHPRLYWDDEITTPTPPSVELREQYARLKKRIMGCTVRKKIAGTIHIGRDALRLWETGAAKILVDGKWYSQAA